MVEDDDPELEFSPLCGDHTRDGITVCVEIYPSRARGGVLTAGRSGYTAKRCRGM
jgi:hypothetical protein